MAPKAKLAYVRRGVKSSAKRARASSPSPSPTSSSSYHPSSSPSVPSSPDALSPPIRVPISQPSAPSSSQPPSPFVSQAQTVQYHALALRPFVPTRFLDWSALQQLGLKLEVEQLLSGIGWESFMHFQFLTYKELTLEFLSSFSTNFTIYLEPDEIYVDFRLLGRARHLTLDSFTSAFGLPSDGKFQVDFDFSSSASWYALTGKSDYVAGLSKSTQLLSPALRIIHRFLVHSLFGRYESVGVVSRDELFFLHCLTHGSRLNVGTWLVAHFQRVVGQKKSSTICIGGLVTCLARSFGFVPVDDVHVPVKGSALLGMGTFVHMHLCRRIGKGRYELILPGGPSAPVLDEDVLDAPAVDPSTSTSAASSASQLLQAIHDDVRALRASFAQHVEFCQQEFSRLHEKLEQLERDWSVE